MSRNDDDRNILGEIFQRNSPQFNEKPTAFGKVENLLAGLQKASVELSGLFFFLVYLPFIYPVIFLSLGIPALIYDAIFSKKGQ